MATIPATPLRFAGIWNNTRTYNYADLVESPINNIAYAVGNATKSSVTGGSDPSVQPSANWVLIPDAGGGGGGVTQITAGTNVSISPVGGTGNVTVNASVPAPPTPTAITGFGATVECVTSGYINATAPNTVTIRSTGDELHLEGQNIQLGLSGSSTDIVANGTIFTNNIENRTTALTIAASAANGINLTPSSGLVSINSAGTGTVGLNLGSSTGTAGQVVSAVGDGTLAWATLPASFTPFLDAQQLYVSPNGNDTTGTGSQQKPFLTIGKALTVRATISTAIEVSIILASGTYTEAVGINQNTYLVGVQTGEARQPCNIVGSILMTGNAGTTQGISGLEITGFVQASGVSSTNVLFACNITYGLASTIQIQSGSAFITECRIANTGNFTTVLNTAGNTTIRDSFITTSSIGSPLSSAFPITVRQCIIQSTSASTSPATLMRLFNTTSIAVEVSLCRLEYTSAATDVGTNKCCIQFSGSAGTVTASVSQSVLLCQGAVTGTPLIQCIQKTGAGAVNLSYGGLLAGATANNIAPAITKTALTPVP